MRDALSELLAHRRIIFGDADNAIVFIDGEALIGNRLLQRVVLLLGQTSFVRGGAFEILRS